jgi:hypothetical protein
MIDTMLAYTRWANALVLDCLAEAPPALLEARRRWCSARFCARRIMVC